MRKSRKRWRLEPHSAHFNKIYNEEGGKGIIEAIIDLKPQYGFRDKDSDDDLKENIPGIRKFIESNKLK